MTGEQFEDKASTLKKKKPQPELAGAEELIKNKILNKIPLQVIRLAVRI